MRLFLTRALLASSLLLPLSSSASAFSNSAAGYLSRRAFSLRCGSSVMGTQEVDVDAIKSSYVETSDTYKKLLAKLNTITQLGRCQSVIGYDQQVFMPKNGESAAERGAQMSALSGVIHEMKTNKDLINLINKCEAEIASEDTSSKGVSDAARLVQLEKKDFLENERVPTELAARSAGHQAKAQQSWQVARAESNFAGFVDDLEQCFSIAMEMAECKRGPESDTPLYSQMMDQFEVGMGKERVDEIFGQIRSALVPLLAEVLKSDSKPKKHCLTGNFPVDQQAELANRLVKDIGYNSDFGRIDVSTHPFTSSSSAKDVRITSRFTDGEWREGIIATLHEGGHAIYEQNLPETPYKIDTALSLGAHESQSLFWERHVALSKAFWRYVTPIMSEMFNDFNYTSDDVYGAVNSVKPSFIRVEADELTYPLHVILRYQIEADVVSGKLAVKDIPKRWNDDMKALLDVDVENDAMGCLQDMHWSAMAIGYFPTYLIGAATAAQLEHFCRKDLPNFEELIEKGEFQPMKDWLTEKIHKHGSRYKSLDEMLEAQVGERLNPKYFVDYLTNKYTDLYEL